MSSISNFTISVRVESDLKSTMGEYIVYNYPVNEDLFNELNIGDFVIVKIRDRSIETPVYSKFITSDNNPRHNSRNVKWMKDSVKVI